MKNRTKVLSLIALGLVVVLGASLYSSGGALQGKFGGVGSSKTVVTNSSGTTSSSKSMGSSLKDVTKNGGTKTNSSSSTTTPVVLVSLTNEFDIVRNVNISMTTLYNAYTAYTEEYYKTGTHASTDPSLFTFGAIHAQFTAGVTPCTGSDYWQYTISHNSSMGAINELLEPIAINVINSSNNALLSTLSLASTASENNIFYSMALPSSVTPNPSGDDYYYELIGQIKDPLSVYSMGKTFTLSLVGACVQRDGVTYQYHTGDSSGQNSSFSIPAADSTGALTLGSLTISE